ncbi:MAG: glycoside hydrolase family 32 protein [Acidobacteriaceae bacterium]
MVDCGGLENRFGRKANGGSNPSPSATSPLSTIENLMLSFRQTSSRRGFLLRGAFVTAASVMPRRLFAELADEAAGDWQSRLARDCMRPQFHLLPARNWMNDPNGPIYHNGRYHMFFQYNPQGTTWGNMSWNHAVSTDMLHWTHRPLALAPTPGGADSFGVFSGSAIQVGKRVYVLYTGTKESTPDLATIRDGQNRIQESQCLAWSDDPELITWNKAPQPVIPMPPPGLTITGFRDPAVWKQGDSYYLAVASGVARVGGCVLLYRSRDLTTWEYLKVLTSGVWNGKRTPNPCDDGEMWECPDFFSLDGGHVLIYSTLGKVFWQSGTFDEKSFTFRPLKSGLLDLDAFYAPKTQLDGHGRRVLWGWLPERRDDAALRVAGWSGMMSLPRVLNLDSTGRLRISTLPETRTLREDPVQPTHTATGTTITVPEANGEIRCIGLRGSSFEATIAAESAELIHVSYNSAANRMTVNGTSIQLESSDIPSFHAFVDASVIELILSNRIGYTKRFYHNGSKAPDLQVRLSGSGVRAEGWTIKPISADRLTTPATL